MEKTIETNMPGKKATYGIYNWGPCILKIKISEEFHKLLLTEANESKKKENLYQEKLAGIIKEEYKFRDRSVFIPYFSQILGVYDEAWQMWKNQKHERKPEYLLTALWVNYQKKHEFNPPHDHSDQLSFVIYLSVPESLKKEHKEFKGKSSGPGGISFLYGEGDRQAITYQAAFPEDRDMFIFPAWCKHYVAPFKTNGTRISVSGNVAEKVSLNAIKKVNE